jgi:hypothetical protein
MKKVEASPVGKMAIFEIILHGTREMGLNYISIF